MPNCVATFARSLLLMITLSIILQCIVMLNIPFPLYRGARLVFWKTWCCFLMMMLREKDVAFLMMSLNGTKVHSCSNKRSARDHGSQFPHPLHFSFQVLPHCRIIISQILLCVCEHICSHNIMIQRGKSNLSLFSLWKIFAMYQRAIWL